MKHDCTVEYFIEWISNKGKTPIPMHIKKEKRNIHITNIIPIAIECVSLFEKKKKTLTMSYCQT